MTDTRRDELELLRNQISQGANWFYWIIGLSLVNALLGLAGANIHFIIGSSFVDAGSGVMSAGSNLSSSNNSNGTYATIAGLVIMALTVAVYGFLGRKAQKPAKWAFIAGMLIYLADGVLYFVYEDFLSGAFHLYVLYKMYIGLSAVDPYLTLEQDLADDPIVLEEQILSTDQHSDYMPPQTEPASAPVADGEKA